MKECYQFMQCRIHDCDRDAKYRYHNKISNVEGTYCEEHMQTRREDVSIREWVDAGFAQRLSV